MNQADWNKGQLLNVYAAEANGHLPLLPVGAAPVATPAATPTGSTASPASSSLLTPANVSLISTGATVLKLGIALVPLIFGGKK